jgi:hypothetical protein
MLIDMILTGTQTARGKPRGSRFDGFLPAPRRTSPSRDLDGGG